MNLTRDLKDILRPFNAHSVKYVIVGAHALGVHAEPRAAFRIPPHLRASSLRLFPGARAGQHHPWSTPFRISPHPQGRESTIPDEPAFRTTP